MPTTVDSMTIWPKLACGSGPSTRRSVAPAAWKAAATAVTTTAATTPLPRPRFHVTRASLRRPDAAVMAVGKVVMVLMSLSWEWGSDTAPLRHPLHERHRAGTTRARRSSPERRRPVRGTGRRPVGDPRAGASRRVGHGTYWG